MLNVPFLAVNVFALCAYILMFTIFIATQKTPEIKAFLTLLIVFVLWTGGSMLMRLQLWPGLRFWYNVSLLAIFSMELFFYLFLHSFAHARGRFVPLLLTAATFALYPGTLSGWFLPAPVPQTLPGGGIVYKYENVTWHMAIPCIVFVLAIAFSLQLLAQMQREQGAHASGARLLFWGGVMMLAGNLLQIFIPGNIFPFDTLAGVCFAFLIIFALYRRRLFRLKLVISRGLLMLAVSAICLLLDIYFVNPLYEFFTQTIHTDSAATLMLLSLALTVLLAAFYTLLHRMIDTLFTREEHQGKLVKQFSSDVVQTLSTDDIMNKTGSVMLHELPVSNLYICLADDHGFVSRYSSDPLSERAFRIDASSPKVRYLAQEPYLLVSEFAASAQALSDWEEEKALFRRLNVDCVAAMRDGSQIVGLILLSARDHTRCFSVSELSFLETISSIASIAMKNAALYETIFREARIDPLTNAYNYRAFVDALKKEFTVHGKDGLTLMYVDADDLKLYNQLYGAQEGDYALRRICEEITLAAGPAGTVYRTSGKVFALLLPGQDTRQAKVLAQEIQKRIAGINAVSERHRFKALSVSIGICSAPYAASSAQELMDNTDLACYNAKQNGKNQIVLFRGATDLVAQQLGERTEAIVGRIERGSGDCPGAFTTISALTAAIDAKDHYTYAHSKNVARYAANLAVAAGLNDEQIRTIYAAGLLHDIGKISIPESVLNKSGKLTGEEYMLMREHVNNSIEMIRHLPEMDYLIPAVMGHHERWDGKGYPRGIAGKEIPLTARCLSIADVFDAMTTDRPYRKGLSPEYAVKEIREGAGVQFDPQLAALFADLVEERNMPFSPQLQERLKVSVH